jgi:hypothetical protein
VKHFSDVSPRGIVGDAHSISISQRTAGGLRRLLEAVGLERGLRDVTNPAPRTRVTASPVRASLIVDEKVPA